MNAPSRQPRMLAALLVLLAACTPAPEPPLRVGLIPWPGTEPLFLARDLGLYPSPRIHLVEYVSSDQSLRAFRNGAIDAISSTLEEVLRFEQLGQEPRVVLVLDASHGADCLMARPEIHALEELRGRKVGTEESMLGIYMLGRMLDQSGLHREDVKLEYRVPDAQTDAYVRGDVDAVITYEPYCQKLANAGAQRLFDSSRIPGEIVDVLMVRASYLREHPAQVDALLRGWFAGLDWHRKHPEEGTRRMARRVGLDEHQFAQTLTQVRFMDEQAQHEQLTGPHPRLLDNMERLKELLSQHGIPLGQPEASRLIDASPLGRVVP